MKHLQAVICAILVMCAIAVAGDGVHTLQSHVKRGAAEWFVDINDKIQDAINNASAGDLIHLLGGGDHTDTNVVINKQLTFSMDSPYSARWTGNDTLFIIRGANRVAFENISFVSTSRTGGLFSLESGGGHSFNGCHLQGFKCELTGDTLVFYENCRLRPLSQSGFTSTGTVSSQGVARFLNTDVGLPGYDADIEYYATYGDTCYGLSAGGYGTIHLRKTNIYATLGQALQTLADGATTAVYFGLIGTRGDAPAVNLRHNSSAYLQYAMISNNSATNPTVSVIDSTALDALLCHIRNDNANGRALKIGTQDNSTLWFNQFGGDIEVDSCNVAGSNDGTTTIYGQYTKMSGDSLIDPFSLVTRIGYHDRQTFQAVQSALTDGVYLKKPSGVAMSSTYGFKAMRSGSITGLSFQINVNGWTGTEEGTITFNARVNDSAVYSVASPTITGVNKYAGYGTQEVYLDRFAAGDLLQINVTFSANLDSLTTNVVDCELEVVYDE